VVEGSGRWLREAVAQDGVQEGERKEREMAREGERDSESEWGLGG